VSWRMSFLVVENGWPVEIHFVLTATFSGK
jgi:hypothetical protein